MMCFKPMLIIKNAGQAKQREQFIELLKFISERRITEFDIDLHAAKNHAFKLAYFTLVEKLAMKWGVGHLLKRSIMKNEIDALDALIEMTITHIKTALDSSKAGEAKVYTEMLVLLRETLSRSLEAQKRMELFDKTYSKPFEKISDKHILDAPLTDRKQNG